MRAFHSQSFLRIMLSVMAALTLSWHAPAQDRLDDPREFGSDPDFAISGLTLDASIEDVMKIFPDASLFVVPFTVPFSTVFVDKVPVQIVIVRINRDAFLLTDDTDHTDDAEGHQLRKNRGAVLRARDFYLSGPARVDLDLEFRFAGGKAMYQIQADVRFNRLSCAQLVTSLTAQNGPPEVNEKDYFLWRSLDVGQQAVFEVRCQQGSHYQALLSDMAVKSDFMRKFDARVEELLQKRNRP